jgi:hypothetical protein
MLALIFISTTRPDLVCPVRGTDLLGRPIIRMPARWKLGRALAKVERGKPGPAGKDRGHDVPYLKSVLEDLQLDKKAAQRAQRIGTLPGEEREGGASASLWKSSARPGSSRSHRADQKQGPERIGGFIPPINPSPPRASTRTLAKRAHAAGLRARPGENHPHAVHVSHTNSRKFLLREAIWRRRVVLDVTEELRAQARNLSDE